MAMIKCILAEQDRSRLGPIILKDQADERKYNLVIENGFLGLQEINIDAIEKDIQLIDIATGQSFRLVVENSILGVQEV